MVVNHSLLIGVGGRFIGLSTRGVFFTVVLLQSTKE